MEHFYRNIQGWFTFPTLYSEAVRQAKENSYFVEVGTWKGCSAAFMAVEIINSGKNIKFDCVDTWEGSEEHNIKTASEKEKLYEEFLSNIEPVKHIINPVRCSSVEASKQYLDNSLDFVFIDAGHDYKSVMEDLVHWYPKVKKGGIISGHDYFHEWPEVVKAVNDFFKNKTLLANSKEVSWMHYK